MRLAEVDDAVLIANALAAPPAMPPELLAAIWFQYAVTAKTPVRIGALGQYLGRRPATAEFWRNVDRAHYFPASRIAPPSTRQEQPKRAA